MKSILIYGLFFVLLFGACGKNSVPEPEKPVVPIVEPPKPDKPSETPTITGFSPLTAKENEEIVITGTGFGTDANNISILFSDGVNSILKSLTSTQMVVLVPKTIATGKITVTFNGKTVIKTTDNFAPVIPSTNPPIIPPTDPPTNPPVNVGYTYTKKLLIMDNGGSGVTDANHVNLLSSTFNSAGAGIISTKAGGTSRLRLFNYSTGRMKVIDGVIEVDFPNMVKLNRPKILADTAQFPFSRVEEINTVTKQITQYYAISDNADAGTSLKSFKEFTALISMDDFVKAFASDNQLILNRPK